eukprot:3937113-Rhodomonas_salina.1
MRAPAVADSRYSTDVDKQHGPLRDEARHLRPHSHLVQQQQIVVLQKACIELDVACRLQYVLFCCLSLSQAGG